VLPAGWRRATNASAVGTGVAVLAILVWRLKIDPVASALATFLGICLLREWLLDALLRRSRGAGNP
jgi:hypothetical protein